MDTSNEITLHAIDKITTGLDPDVKEEYLNELQFKKTSETGDLHTTLLFKKGAKVEISTNLDTTDGL